MYQGEENSSVAWEWNAKLVINNIDHMAASLYVSVNIVSLPSVGSCFSSCEHFRDCKPSNKVWHPSTSNVQDLPRRRRLLFMRPTSQPDTDARKESFPTAYGHTRCVACGPCAKTLGINALLGCSCKDTSFVLRFACARSCL